MFRDCTAIFNVLSSTSGRTHVWQDSGLAGLRSGRNQVWQDSGLAGLTDVEKWKWKSIACSIGENPAFQCNDDSVLTYTGRPMYI